MNIKEEHTKILDDYSKNKSVLFMNYKANGSLHFGYSGYDVFDSKDFLDLYCDHNTKHRPSDLLDKKIYFIVGSIDSCGGTLDEVGIITTDVIPKEIVDIYRSFYIGKYEVFLGQYCFEINCEMKYLNSLV